MFYWILGGIAAGLILILALLIFLRKWKLKKLGIDGEKKVSNALKKFAGIRSYKVLDDVYLPLYDKTTQIDHILIGFFGILVVETKNYKGEVYGEPKKKDWLHIVGGKKINFYNPIMQNQAHIECLRHILGEEKIYSVNIESLIVFSNNKLELNVPNGLPIVKFDKLSKLLRTPRFEKDNNFDVELLTKTILKHAVTDKAKIKAHNKNVKEMANNNK